MWKTETKTAGQITVNSNINISIKIKFAICLRITARKISNHIKSSQKIHIQIGGLDSMWYDHSPEGIPKQNENSTKLLKLGKNMLNTLTLLSVSIIN